MNTICSIQHIRDDNPLCASFSIRVAGSGSVRITGEFPSVLAMQYKLDIRDEKYHHRIFNMEAMPLTLHSIMTFASYLRRQFKLEPTTRDIARDILNDTYDEYPDFVQYIISVQKKNRKDKDLMLYCIAKGTKQLSRVSQTSIRTIASELRKHPDCLCIRDRFCIPRSYAFYHTYKDVQRVLKYLQQPLMLKDRIQELQNIIQQYSSTWSSSRDPKYSSRFMTKTEDGLWVYTMDIERKTRCMDPLFARAKLVIADPENVPHHQTSKFIVPHMDDIKYVQQHVSSTIAPEVYQRQDIWQETDSIVILYAHRYSILDWAFIWESATHVEDVTIVGRTDVRSPFLNYIRENNNPCDVVMPLSKPNIVHFQGSLSKCFHEAAKRFRTTEIQIFGKHGIMEHDRVFVSGPRRIRTVCNRVGDEVQFWENDEPPTRWVKGSASAILPNQWPGGIIACAIVNSTECFRPQDVEALCVDTLYYVYDIPTKI